MFINNLPAREHAERVIGDAASEFSDRLERDEVTAREMILACRRFLNLWIEGGGASIDDEVIGLLGIESQCDHVMLRPGQRKPRFPEYDGDEEAEIERLGEFFLPSFAREMRELVQRFGAR
jgi:hypothetical protein